jgi:hypothetical protein
VSFTCLSTAPKCASTSVHLYHGTDIQNNVFSYVCCVLYSFHSFITIEVHFFSFLQPPFFSSHSLSLSYSLTFFFCSHQKGIEMKVHFQLYVFSTIRTKFEKRVNFSHKIYYIQRSCKMNMCSFYYREFDDDDVTHSTRIKMLIIKIK